MENIWQTTHNALELLFTGDDALLQIIAVSLNVSLTAMFISIPIALSIALLLVNYPSKITQLLVSLIQTLMAVPAVVIGLLVYLLLARQGVFGNLHWLFSQKAMVVGQIFLALPILISLYYSGLCAVNVQAKETAITLGAKSWQVMLTLLFECRFALITAIASAFGRIIAEVGCAMMVGGNILNETRNITTAIALETHKGDFSQGIALGIVLVLLAFIINITIYLCHKKINSYA